MNTNTNNILDLTVETATTAAALNLTLNVTSVELVKFNDHDVVEISGKFPTKFIDMLPWSGENNLTKARVSAEGRNSKILTFVSTVQAYKHACAEGVDAKHPFPVIYGKWKLFVGSCYVDTYTKDGVEKSRWMCRDFVPLRPDDPEDIDVPDPIEDLDVRDHRDKKEEPRKDETDDIK